MTRGTSIFGNWMRRMRAESREEHLIDDDRIYEGFVRQRRKLLGISVLLFVYLLAGVSIEQISLFGNDFPIESPEYLVVGLWMLHIYWLFRYYQYFRDLDRVGFHDLATYRMEETIIPRLGLKTVKQGKFTKYLEENFPDGKIDVVDTDTRQSQGGLWVVHLTVRFQSETHDKYEESDNKRETIPLEGWPVRLAWLQAYSWMFLNTRLFTEFILPFFVGAAPFLAWILTTWTLTTPEPAAASYLGTVPR